MWSSAEAPISGTDSYRSDCNVFVGSTIIFDLRWLMSPAAQTSWWEHCCVSLRIPRAPQVSSSLIMSVISGCADMGQSVSWRPCPS